MEETITTLRLEDVYPSPKHYREVTKANVDKIAASIAEAGQLVPIEVWPDGDIYFVDQGHHRLAAMKQLGHETIRAIVTDAASAVSMVASNLSIPETELEKSRGTQLMLETGIRPEEAAAHIGESVERVERAVRGLKTVWEAAEDMTLDRLIAVADFEDDTEAVKQIMSAREGDWQRIHKSLDHRRKGAESVDQKTAIIEASGCELVPEEVSVSIIGMAYVDSGDEKPDGATMARISYSEYWQRPEAVIFWYAPADADDDPEEVERKARAAEDAEMLRLALESMDSKRIEFVGAHLRNEGPVTSGNYLRDLAVSSWESGSRTSDGDISEDLDGIKGFVPRVYAALLSVMDKHAVIVMQYVAKKNTSGYYFESYASETLRYYAALKGVGYEPTELEASLLAALETILIDKEDDDE